MHAKSGEFDFSQIYLKLFLEIILPVIIGLLLRTWLHQFTIRFSRQLTLFDKSVILLIVYRSFAASFHAGYFEGISWPDLLILIALVIGLFFLVYGIILSLTRAFGFNREDRITALFCGSQKSLVHGSVFSNVLFAGMSIAGIMLLPLMIFHAFQIFIISVISSRYASREGV
jgi:solute carrier family 10 (sodium/bile acid cotransporter), member 7